MRDRAAAEIPSGGAAPSPEAELVDQEERARLLAAIDRLSDGERIAVADEHGCTPAQAAIAWLVARPAPPAVIPILGARTEAQAAENLAALELRLDDDALARLDDASRPKLGFPRDLLESAGVRELIFGATFERLVPI